MDESAFILSLVEAVRKNLAGSGSLILTGITVRVGIYTGIDTERLAGRFAELTRGTPLQGVRLVIEEAVPGLRCMDCGAEAEEKGPFTSCPECASTSVVRLTGHELEVVSIEAG